MLNANKSTLLNTLILSAMLATSVSANAETKPPIAQYWMDVTTNNMSIPGMGGLGSMMGMGGAGKSFESDVFTRNKPQGTTATHAIPSALNMGSSLPLVPPVGMSTGGKTEGSYEKPKGRVLFYWGCGDKVRSGQPRIFDVAKVSSGDYGKFISSRSITDRGASRVSGRSGWPNEKETKNVPENASLNGEHVITGEGIPENLKFNIGAEHDFMPKVEVSATGDVKNAVNVSWNSVKNATGYYAMAVGSKENQDVIMWSSSEKPDGFNLTDYFISPAQVEKLIKEKVVLSNSTQTCTIPAGIYAETNGAMVRTAAYGPELNLAHPPRPANLKETWKPDWTALIRVRSIGMAMLGGNASGGGSRSSQDGGGRDYTAANSGSNSDDPTKGTTNPVDGAVKGAKKLKDLFGF